MLRGGLCLTYVAHPNVQHATCSRERVIGSGWPSMIVIDHSRPVGRFLVLAHIQGQPGGALSRHLMDTFFKVGGDFMGNNMD